MSDLRQSRPYLVLNSTNGTTGKFHDTFAFTDEYFNTISSSIDQYSLARAVMGTATFPAVFNYMTLRDFSKCATRRVDERFVHVFDGGNSDNLGLLSVIAMIETMRSHGTLPSKVIVILVDAYTDKAGVSAERPDPRSPTDFIVDSNFVAATDSLLSGNRDKMLDAFRLYFTTQFENKAGPQRSVFYHVEFADIQNDPMLNAKLNGIPTDFAISEENAGYIDAALDQLFTRDNGCLQAIKDVLTRGSHQMKDVTCKYSR